MTTEHEASRTLVKSPPELWAECSDAGSLARHLGEFGEITITRLEPETTVAWEGERASGTVRIEPSGWGTRVTLTAQTTIEAQKTPGDGPNAVLDEAPPTIDGPSSERSSEPDEEESHATLEETLETAHPVPVSEAGAFRIRWRRMSERMRGLFRGPAIGTVAEAGTARTSEPVTTVEPLEAGQPEPLESQAAPLPEQPDPTTPAEPASESDLDPEVILTAALDSLGQAHHRPFSRA